MTYDNRYIISPTVSVVHWTKQMIIATVCSVVISDVVEVNEKDLVDRGINISPSEFDIFLPVVSPTKAPSLKLNTQKTTQIFPSGEMKNEVLNMENALNKISSSMKTSSFTRKINSSQKETSVEEGDKFKMLQMVLKSGSNSLTKINSPTKNPKDKNSETKKPQMHPKHVNYYNNYDVDKPVKIRRIQKHEPILTKEKQQSLNNTLAMYGLHLDAQGQSVILHDTRDNSGSISREIHKHKEGIKEHEAKNRKMRTELKGRMAETHLKRKNVDTIKSLWSILNNVSEKWK